MSHSDTSHPVLPSIRPHAHRRPSTPDPAANMARGNPSTSQARVSSSLLDPVATPSSALWQRATPMTSTATHALQLGLMEHDPQWDRAHEAQANATTPHGPPAPRSRRRPPQPPTRTVAIPSPAPCGHVAPPSNSDLPAAARPPLTPPVQPSSSKSRAPSCSPRRLGPAAHATRRLLDHRHTRRAPDQLASSTPARALAIVPAPARGHRLCFATWRPMSLLEQPPTLNHLTRRYGNHPRVMGPRIPASLPITWPPPTALPR